MRDSVQYVINIKSFCDICHDRIEQTDDTDKSTEERLYFYRRHTRWDKVSTETEDRLDSWQLYEDENITGYMIRIEKFVIWIKERISEIDHYEFKDKIILSVESEEALMYVAALTKELRRILTDSSDKEKFIKNERFGVDNPYWPARWFVHVTLKTMEEIPEVLWELQQVEYLKFSSGMMEEVPVEIGKFKHLKYLDISGNDISALPTSLQCCKKLQEIHLEFNEFKRLPLFLLNFPNLQTFCRSGNPFAFTILKRKAVIEDPELECEETDEKESDNGCATLKSLCLQSLRKQKIADMDIFALNLPRNLKKNIYDSFFSSHVLCDCCHRGGLAADEAFQCYIDMNEFCGCKIIPFKGYLCSKQCAKKMAEQLDARNKGFVNPIVPVYGGENQSRVHRRKSFRQIRRIPRTLSMFNSCIRR